MAERAGQERAPQVLARESLEEAERLAGAFERAIAAVDEAAKVKGAERGADRDEGDRESLA